MLSLPECRSCACGHLPEDVGVITNQVLVVFAQLTEGNVLFCTAHQHGTDDWRVCDQKFVTLVDDVCFFLFQKLQEASGRTHVAINVHPLGFDLIQPVCFSRRSMLSCCNVALLLRPKARLESALRRKGFFQHPVLDEGFVQCFPALIFRFCTAGPRWNHLFEDEGGELLAVTGYENFVETLRSHFAEFRICLDQIGCRTYEKDIISADLVDFRCSTESLVGQLEELLRCTQSQVMPKSAGASLMTLAMSALATS